MVQIFALENAYLRNLGANVGTRHISNQLNEGRERENNRNEANESNS
jgi:hypothetical protein